MNYKGFKKTHEDEEKAVLKNEAGHAITIAKKSLSKKLLSDLRNLPLHRAEEGMVESPDAPATDQDPEIQSKQDVLSDLNQQAQDLEAPQTQPEQAQAAPQDAPVEQAPMDQQQSPAPQDAQPMALQQYTAKDQAFQNDLNNGHIQPETYHDLFAKKDTLGKIGTLFGLLVSGAGSGLAHQPNAVMQMMNNEINNDLEAQKASKANAQNYLKINQAHEMNQANIALMQKQGLVDDATAKKLQAETSLIPATLTKLVQEGKLDAATANATQVKAATDAYVLSQWNMQRAALHDLVQQTNKLPNGSPQKQSATQALGLMYNAINNDRFNVVDRMAAAQSLMGFSGNQPQANAGEQQFQQQNQALRLSGNEKIAEANEEHHFPGLQGAASHPLGPADREALGSGINFDRKLNDFIDWAKGHSGDLSIPDRNEGEARAAELQGAYRQATDGGVYKESESNFISKIIDDTPTKFFNKIRVLPQLNALADQNRQRVDQTAKNLGFPGYQGYQPQAGGAQPKAQPANAPAEGATGTFKNKPVIFKNGKWSYK